MWKDVDLFVVSIEAHFFLHSLNKAKKSCPTPWLDAKIRSFEEDQDVNKNVVNLYKAEKKRRKDRAAAEKTTKNTYGSVGLWRSLNKAIQDSMTDEEILALPEAALADVVWRAWLKDADTRPEPIQSKCLPIGRQVNVFDIKIIFKKKEQNYIFNRYAKNWLTTIVIYGKRGREIRISLFVVN